MDSQTFALVLAGLVSPFVTWLVKKVFSNPQSYGALWLAFVVSVVLAFIAEAYTKGFTGFPSILEPAAIVSWFVDKALVVFGISQVVYQNLKSKLSL
jgi:uncharacterized membrane protein YhdT